MTKPDLSGIKNIIFDFGRVLLNINPILTQKALMKLGFRQNSNPQGQSDDDIVEQLESGKITADEFIDNVLQAVKENSSRQDVADAWNAMLLDFPVSHLEKLKELKKHYRLFLLSNSNQIHYDSYVRSFREAHGSELSELFEKMWFSFNIGIIKPDTAIFRYVLNDARLVPEETLFIDDTLVHVEAARAVGIRAYHLEGDTDICDVL